VLHKNKTAIFHLYHKPPLAAIMVLDLEGVKNPFVLALKALNIFLVKLLFYEENVSLFSFFG